MKNYKYKIKKKTNVKKHYFELDEIFGKEKENSTVYTSKMSVNLVFEFKTYNWVYARVQKRQKNSK